VRKIDDMKFPSVENLKSKSSRYKRGRSSNEFGFASQNYKQILTDLKKKIYKS
jgi:hypothetical protein